MGVELSVDPPVCPIEAFGGVSKHKIINHTDKMLAIKVKTSNNSHYSVNVVYSLLQIGYTCDLVITRVRGPPKADSLVVEYACVEQDCRDAKAVFANGKPKAEIVGETRVKLSAAE